MPILGRADEPAFSYHAYSGSTTPNQEAEDLTAPSRIRIKSVGLWIAGWSGTCRVKACIWANDGTLLAQSAETVIPSGGAAGPGNAQNVVIPLLTEPVIEKDVTFRVGFNRDRDDAHQVSTGSTVNGHFHGRAAYTSAGDFGEIESYGGQSRRIGCYVADYRPAAAAWIYDGADWVQAETVMIYDGADWVDADALQVYDGADWADAL